MSAFGLQTHIWQNNRNSLILLAVFPFAIMLASFGLVMIAAGLGYHGDPQGAVNAGFAQALLVMSRVWPFILGGVAIWFFIAFGLQQGIIDSMTGARPVSPAEEPRAARLLENLCISRGLVTPQLRVIETGALNAFASGLQLKNASITLTRGILRALDDDELEAVLAHELTHIQNRDVRLVVIAGIFVGIIALVAESLLHSIRYVNLPRTDRSRRSGGGEAAILIVGGIVLLALAYGLSVWARFALSRRREYLADAGAVELTKNPDAMVRVLQKVSGRSRIAEVPDAVAELFLDHHPTGWQALFATHPSIEDRIEALRQFAGARPELASERPGSASSLQAQDATDRTQKQPDPWGDRSPRGGRGPWG